jgi:hypothetical protein
VEEIGEEGERGEKVSDKIKKWRWGGGEKRGTRG